MDIPEHKLPFLNVGCGNKFHPDWVNVDMHPNHPDVLHCNLMQGIPFPDNSFEVVYHSQVLEHFPRDRAPDFLRECHRVLKPGGILRVVVPDLENIVDEYKKHLRQLKKGSNKKTAASYDWVVLELLDQSVRHHSGGMMAEYLQQKPLPNQKYIVERIGAPGSANIEQHYAGQRKSLGQLVKKHGLFGLLAKALRLTQERVKGLLLGERYRIGRFRTGGEIHLWMYDSFSLPRLLKACQFKQIKIQKPTRSDIADWSSYHLDMNQDGQIYDPTSLFVEARK